ncbi:MAG: hypothetical protein [Caudoviricetes sp.]|nr:MAG: hypothetical protein [Caudoviricetes sp.]
MVDEKEMTMSYEWGRYTLTVTDLRTQKVVFKDEYKGMSGQAMMDETFSLRLQYPSKHYRIDW